MFELIPFDSPRGISAFDPFRVFDEMERSFFGSAPASAHLGFRTDVSDVGDAFRLEAELPGFKKEDINVEINDEVLTISAERKSEANDEQPNYVKRERYYGSYKRSFDISGINADSIDAQYTDGVLVLNMPKKVPAVPESRKLEIR